MSKTIIAAWGELCSGPGWANRIINVLEADDRGKLSIRAIQPAQQTAEMHALLKVSALVTRQMVAAVESAKRKRKAQAETSE